MPDPHNIGFRYPHQVSGGQLQRAMVAMAMACKPDLIMFDEPTTALDVTTQIEVLAAIKDIVHQFNTAAIYITHDLAVVAQVADRIMVLRYGDLVEEGEVREDDRGPQEDYTRQLLAVRSYRKEEADRHPRASGRFWRSRTSRPAMARRVMVLTGHQPQEIHRRTVAVVGESGSGKSTLARVITGSCRRIKGSVLYNGDSLPASYKSATRDQLRALQMIYQMPDIALNPRQRFATSSAAPSAVLSWA